MIKSWYSHVREETMAPARMVSFMEQHVTACDICRHDPDLKEEMAKITELVLPESKIPKAIRQKSSQLDEIAPEEEEEVKDEKEEDSETLSDEEEEEDLSGDNDDLGSNSDDDI